MTWVLIILMSGAGVSTSVAASMHEFKSQAACEDAATRVNDEKFEYAEFHAFCVKNQPATDAK